MSVLGHFFEDEGLSTTGISLVREHAEAIRPPRSLWVPFELGRPLGAPGDPAFQRRVILAALELLEAERGPVLADFPDDAAAGSAGEGWACPVPLPLPEARGTGLGAAVAEEVGRLRTWYEAGRRTRERTTVGLSGLEIEAVAAFLAGFLDDPLQPPFREGLSRGAACKLASEDLKAFYAEAANAQPGTPSSRRTADWFWGETAAGELILELKRRFDASEDKSLKGIAVMALVPRSQQHRLG